ncbi:MAG: hypothetical protein U0871_04870 [Gemmataceae bacterium]
MPPPLPVPRPMTSAGRGPTAARGVGLFLLGVLGAAAAAIAVDARFDLPAAARGLVFAGWLVLAVGLAHAWVVAPLSRPVPAGEWAAAARAAGETGLAALLTAVFFATALLVPGAGERVRRFAVPWYVPGGNAPFRVVVPSGDVTVARGETVTLTAYLEPQRPGEPTPDPGVLVLLRDPESGAESGGVEVKADELAVFAWTVRPDRGFDYRVRAGAVTSGWFKVRVADPVRLTAGTRVEVRPPAYRSVPSLTAPGFADIRGPQFGAAVLLFEFSAPPADARLEFQADGGEFVRLPVRLSPDGRGTATLPLTRDGTAHLTVTQKDGLTSRHSAEVRVAPDEPPRFVTLVGLPPRPVTARPGEQLDLQVEAVDDSRVTGVWVDFCANGDLAAVSSHAVSTVPLGPGRVGGRVRLALSTPGQEAREIWLRVRAADDRTTADPKIGPQAALYPATGWAVIRLADSAPPVADQILQAHREETARRLATVLQGLDATGGERFRPGADGPLPHDQAIRLQATADAGTTAASELADVADGLARIPDLRPLADAIRVVAAGPLRTANRYALAAVEADSAVARDLSISAARTHWLEAGERLRRLTAAIDRAGQARIDRAAISRLAEELRLAGPSDLQATAASVRQRLEGLTHRSPVVRAAVDAAAAEEAVDLAGRVRTFAHDVTALTHAAEATATAARRAAAAGPAGRQVAQDRAAAGLVTRYATPLRLADAPPPVALTAGRAAGRLTAGDATGAVNDQEKAAHEAAGLADALRRAADARADPKEAARQLARWQADLVRRAADAAPAHTPADRGRFTAEQRVLAAAVALLPAGPDDTARTAQLRAVKQAMSRAEEGMRTAAADLPARLTEATSATARLADLTPGRAEQRKVTAARLDELTRQFEAIRREAEGYTRTAPGGLSRGPADLLAVRVTDLAGGVRRLAGPEPTTRAAAEACDRLAADLKAGADHDFPASLRDVRRCLARVATALAGKPTADELAVELAGVLRLATDRADTLPDRPMPADLEPITAALRDATKLVRAVSEDEGGILLAQVREAVAAAEQSVRRPDAAREVRRHLATATSAAATLANRLTGGEPAVERVRRVARRRADWAARLARPETGATVREADRSVAGDIDEIEQTRTGPSRTAKLAALAALGRARTGGGNAAGLHRSAADALRYLADDMAAHGDGLTADAPVGPSAPAVVADPLAEFSDFLPTTTAADEFRRLADGQRAIRDGTAAVAATSLRGVEPATDDTLASVLAELQPVVHSASRFVPADRPDVDPISPLRVGAVRPAVDAAARLARTLRTVKDPECGPLADRLDALTARLKLHSTRYDIQAARQRRRRSELATEAAQLANAYRATNEPSWAAVADQAADMKAALSTTSAAALPPAQALKEFENAANKVAAPGKGSHSLSARSDARAGAAFVRQPV